MAKNLRVLHYEDNEREATLIKRALRKEWPGLDILRVDTAASFEVALSERAWDVVLSEVMPEFDVTAALQGLQRSGKDIPFIVVSSAIQMEEAVSLLRHGAHDFVRKDELSRLIPAMQRELGDADIRRRKHEAELALAQSEKRLKFLISSSPAEIYTSKAYGDYAATFISGNLIRKFGYEPDDFLNNPGFWAEHIHPDDVQRVMSDLEALEEYDHYVHEYRFRTKDGVYRWMRDECKLIRGDKGDPQSIVGNWIDVTETKEAEQEVERTRDRFAVYNQIQSIFLTVPDDDMYAEILHSVILRVLKSKYGVFGYLDENGALVVPTMSREVWPQCQVPDKNITFPRETWGNSSWPRAVREKQTNWLNEVSSKVPEGHIPMLRHISLPIIFHDECIGLIQVANKETDYDENDVRLLEAIGNHIAPLLYSRRQQIIESERLKKSEAFNKDVIQSSRDCIMTLSIDGVLLSMSKGGQELMEIKDLDRYINLSWIDLWEGGDHIAMQNAVEFAARGGTGTFEGYAPTKIGKPIYWDVIVSPMYDQDGNVERLLAVWRNINDRKEAEAERLRTQKLDSLGSLAGGVAHDINNMLLPILNLTPMVLRELPEGNPGRRKLEMVIKAAQRMKDMAARILAFNREDEGEATEIDIFEVYTEALDLLRSTLPTTIKIRDDIDPNTGKVMADPKMIEAVLMNLASNAGDAMAGKTGEIAIALSSVEVDQSIAQKIHGLKLCRYAKTVFSDTGCGMDEATLKRIYDPFFTTKERGEGTGLGMSMIFGTVSKYNGVINVSSEVGTGTTFEIYLPLVKGA